MSEEIVRAYIFNWNDSAVHIACPLTIFHPIVHSKPFTQPPTPNYWPSRPLPAVHQAINSQPPTQPFTHSRPPSHSLTATHPVIHSQPFTHCHPHLAVISQSATARLLPSCHSQPSVWRPLLIIYQAVCPSKTKIYCGKFCQISRYRDKLSY